MADDNICGKNLLRLASRGSAIIAELLRLGENIPDAFREEKDIRDPQQAKYAKVIFDMGYLKDPEEFERRINDSDEMIDLDAEVQENYDTIIQRFYVLFESIWLYQQDVDKYITDVNDGYYIMHSIESLLSNIEGRQLLTEAVYLYGIMLLFMEEKIPGAVRERVLVSNYRFLGEAKLVNFDAVAKLCRSTGYVPGKKKPKNHPDGLFNRCCPNKEFVRTLIGMLLTNDVYLMDESFPHPDHRVTKLATQGSMLYVILYFYPDYLYKQQSIMREIVDRHFSDTWTIAIYMGTIVDLTVEWGRYPAAKAALNNVTIAANIDAVMMKNHAVLMDSLKQLQDVQVEGVLTTEYLLKNTKGLLNLARNCNHALRWRMLHRNCKDEGLRKKVRSKPNSGELLGVLLQLSQFENTLKGMLAELLDGKEAFWESGKRTAVDYIVEVADYFTGAREKMTKVAKDDDLHAWFSALAEQLNGLNFVADKAGSVGRKVQGIVSALDDVAQYEAVDTNIQIKHYLSECKVTLRSMVQHVNVKASSLSILENVADLSFAWGTLLDYLDDFHVLIRNDPMAVVQLRHTVLKAASILDVPLVRIVAIDSPDAPSVAQYYSAQLVNFVRTVLGVIPKSIFELLREVVDIQTNKMTPVPLRLESQHLKNYAQLDLRFRLAKLTHQASVFTEGILLMEKTLLGVIQVDPRQILEEGLRQELVWRIATAFNSCLQFPEITMDSVSRQLSKLANSLDGLKQSVQYIQDYIDMPGLKIYQQELARVINYFTEQEANRYLKKKTFDQNSQFQSSTIPIPRFQQPADDSSGSITFMGRIMHALLTLTDAAKTVYVPELSAWLNHPAPDQRRKNAETVEVCGIHTFSLVQKSLGVIGMRGLDRLLAFRIVNELNIFLKMFDRETEKPRAWLETFRERLSPDFKMPVGGMKTYMEAMKRLEPLMLPLLKTMRVLGQCQLLRRQLSNVLQFSCQLEAQQLSEALGTLNKAVLSDVHAHYRLPAKYPYPPDGNPLLTEVGSLLESSGIEDPLQKIYITTQPVEGLPVVLLVFLLTYLRTLYVDEHFGTLIRTKAKFQIDGVPLVVGCATLLRQFHPAAMEQLVAHLGQFVRLTLTERNAAAASKERMPAETVNTLFFLDQLCYMGYISRATVYKSVPAYIFDSI